MLIKMILSVANFIYALSSSPIKICMNFVFRVKGQYCQDGCGCVACVITKAVREVSNAILVKINLISSFATGAHEVFC